MNATADGAQTIVAAVPNRQIRVVAFVLTIDVAGEIVIQDATSNAERARFQLDGPGGVSFAGDEDGFAWEHAVGEGLELVNPVGTDTTGFITYAEV